MNKKFYFVTARIWEWTFVQRRLVFILYFIYKLYPFVRESHMTLLGNTFITYKFVTLYITKCVWRLTWRFDHMHGVPRNCTQWLLLLILALQKCLDNESFLPLKSHFYKPINICETYKLRMSKWQAINKLINRWKYRFRQTSRLINMFCIEKVQQSTFENG